MSRETTPRVRKNASPSPKQGPIRATWQFGLLQSSPTKNIGCLKNSPSSSPIQLWHTDTYKNRILKSRDRTSPENSSPTSPGYRVERPKPIRPAQMKKSDCDCLSTAELYLSGQWTRELSVPNTVWENKILNVDKATQTPEEWESRDLKKHKRSSSVGNGPGEHLKEYIKQKLVRNKTNGAQRCNSVQGDYVYCCPSRSMAIPISNIPKPVIVVMGSVEGLNQEVQDLARLDLKTVSSIDTDSYQEDNTQENADGRQAPTQELLSSQSRSTQTPYYEQVSSPTSPCLPIIPGLPDDEEQDMSPQDVFEEDPGKFLFVREPPDGCEKVKVVEENRGTFGSAAPLWGEELVFIRTPKSLTKLHIPSSQSAFCPLYKAYMAQKPSDLCSATDLVVQTQ